MPRTDARVPEKTRRAWARTYEESSYRELPWFSSSAYPSVRDAVDQQWFPSRSRILDVGCGAGTNSIFLRRSRFRVHGVDLAPGAVAAARRRADRAGLTIDFREGDVLRLPFPKAFFGGAIDVGCFHTLPLGLRPAYSTELARVLRPRGRFLLCWVARECRIEQGPPHRPSLAEVTGTFEKEFQFLRTGYDPGRWGSLPAYHALLERRATPQPPPR